MKYYRYQCSKPDLTIVRTIQGVEDHGFSLDPRVFFTSLMCFASIALSLSGKLRTILNTIGPHCEKKNWILILLMFVVRSVGREQCIT